MNSSENADIPSDLEYSNMPNNGRMSDEMSDRLPIAERIREAFMDGAFTYEWSLENGKVFDRWLASVKAEAIAEFIDEKGIAVDGVLPLLAKAWDEGHKHVWRLGPDECQCYAHSWSECGCGKYGTGELLSLNDNPYREEKNERRNIYAL